MFFRKDIFNIKPAALDPEAETAEDEVRNPPSDTRPVYVIGDNALTCYLAAKLTDAGHDVIVIAGKENNLSFSTNGISLKEDSSLKLSRYKFNTSFWIKEEPKLVIIAADAGHVNASLAAVAKDKIGAAPVLCFTPLKDVNYIEAMVGGNLFRAFFDGYLQQNGQQVFLYGRTPQVKICKNVNWEKENPFPDIFAYTGLNIGYETDTVRCYWEFFAPYAVGSLLSALNNKNLFDITKDKQLRDQIPRLIAETAAIAARRRTGTGLRAAGQKALRCADELSLSASGRNQRRRLRRGQPHQLGADERRTQRQNPLYGQQPQQNPQADIQLNLSIKVLCRLKKKKKRIIKK